MKKIISVFLLAVVSMTSCVNQSQEKDAVDTTRSRHLKENLQGVWLDDITEQPIIKVEGDSVYVFDRFSIPQSFTIHGDTLVILGRERITYVIQQLKPHTFRFYTSIGDVVSLHKTENDSLSGVGFAHEQLPEKKQVTKKDTIVMHHGIRYRAYAYINPTTKRVYHPGVTSEGIIVDNVYYDNVIHICVYQNKQRLCAKDIHKEMLEGTVPSDFLKTSILADMNFVKVSSKGFHYRAMVQVPDEMTCYHVNVLIDEKNQLTFGLKE